ncbi:MAG TPA: hypothetical protein QGF05_00435 [Dehalococcoidia bacterium]|nr:hypothetical protein [Dehalococcoidia bacterium]
MDTAELDDAKYISLTTYKRDGSGVATPMWLVGADGMYQVITEAES